MQGLDDDDKPPFLGRRVAPGIKMMAIVGVSIALMLVDYKHESLSPVRSILAVALAPLQMAAEIPGDTADYLQRYLNRGQLIRENDKLSQQVLLLQGRLQKLAALQAENERIRALLASASTLDQNVLIARILSVSPDPYRQTIELSKGSSDGVFAGQALIDAHGIMGQVVSVTPLASRAILISDANHGIPVQINRTGLQTIAQGTGRSDQLELPFLPNNADVKSGDLLVSSGLGGRYPADYPVGTITHVIHHPGEEFLDITAAPAARLGHSREVLLVWNQTPPAADAGRGRPRRSGTDNHLPVGNDDTP